MAKVVTYPYCICFTDKRFYPVCVCACVLKAEGQSMRIQYVCHK